jgi:hypothetical protein
MKMPWAGKKTSLFFKYNKRFIKFLRQMTFNSFHKFITFKNFYLIYEKSYGKELLEK